MTKKVSLSLIIVFVLALTVSSIIVADSGSQRFVVSVDNIANFKHTDSGVFNTPVGAAGPGPLLPGASYSWNFNANPGDNLSFATMFVQSNDWFFAPDELGIPLYGADGTAVTGDVTHYVKLWDAGTEIDQPAGEGADQAPRQAGANSGAIDTDNTVRRVLTDALPRDNELLYVTLSYHGNHNFTVNIKNISGTSSFATPLAPGVGVVHNTPAPLFINGATDWNIGLEALAEDGNPAGLASAIANYTGVNTPFAPVAWAVDTSPNPLFTVGTSASAGLEMLAEDGSPVGLVGEQSGVAGAAAIGRGASGPGPIFAPTGNYSFEITASPGDHLSLAYMFVQSNDWFFSLNNVPLFDASGNPISGGVTDAVRLYDAGTEVNQTPGFGSNQAPRQAGSNTGATEGGVIHGVTGHSPSNYTHVTITPIN